MPKARRKPRSLRTKDQYSSDGGLHTTIMSIGPHFDPMRAIRKITAEALDPVVRPGPVKTKSDFTPEQIAEMEKLYGGKR